MAKFTIIVISLMCVIILSFSHASHEMTEEYMHEIMHFTVQFKGYNNILDIGEIYSINPNPANFKPGNRFLIYYEHHKEIPVFIREQFFGTKNPKNAAMAYEPQYIKDKYRLVKGDTNKLKLIIGNPRTGKSTTLEIFEMKYRRATEKGLTIFMDLPKIIEANVKVESLTFEYLIERSVSDIFSELVKNVVELNPSRIKFFIDGLDQVPHKRDKLLSIVSEAHNRGIDITATSCTDVRSNLAIKSSEVTKIRIPSSIPDTEILDYTKRVWRTIYRIQGSSLGINNIHLDKYMKIFKIITQDTPMPRTFEMALQMAVLFTNPASIRPIAGPGDYIVNSNALFYAPHIVVEASDRMHFHKMKFYDEYFEHLNPMIEVYGPIAIDMITKNTEARPQIKAAKKLLSEHGPDAFKFLIFANKEPIHFVHPEFKRYFAAKYVVDGFKTESPLVEIFKEMIAKPTHAFTLEFIDSAINDVHNKPIKERIRSLLKTIMDTEASNKWAHRVADNLIEYRMDNLCSEMFKAMGETRLTEYLNDRTVQLRSKNKYGMGMMAETKPIDTYDYIPRKTLLMYSGNRVEMIMNLIMYKSKKVLADVQYPVDAKIVLEAIAKHEPSNIRPFLERHRDKSLPTEVLNKIMYQLVNSLGVRSLQAIRTLKEFGGTPENVNVDGRTLTHAIVEICNREFLETAHREFNIPLVETPSMKGNTILFALLDSGMAFNTISAPGAWETMAYLLEHGDVSWSIRYINAHPNKFRYFEPSLMGKPDAYLKLLIKSHATFKIRMDYVNLMFNYVPIRDWDMPSKVSAVRRKVLIKNCFRNIDSGRQIVSTGRFRVTHDSLTLTEVIVSHLDLYGRSQYQHYLDCVKILLRNEGNTFNSFQSQRVFEAIAKNVYEPSRMPDINLETLKIRIAMEVVPHVPQLDVVAMVTAFEDRRRHRIPARSVDRTIDSVIVETMYDDEFHSAVSHQNVEMIAKGVDDGYDSASEFYFCSDF